LGKTIFYPPTVCWSREFQRPHQIMRLMAQRGWTVFWGSPRLEDKELTELERNIFLVHDWRRWLKSVDYQVDVLYWTHPRQAEFPDLSRVACHVSYFESLDEFPEWDAHEPLALSMADVVSVVSDYLMRKQAKRHPRVFMSRNAADPSAFSGGGIQIPSEYRKLERPIAGLVGVIAQWIDLEILEAVSKVCTVVHVGTIWGDTPKGEIPPSVHLLGYKGYSALAPYYKGLDVGLVPFKLSKIGVASCPIKTYEYLAAGLPVVSTPLPESLVLAPFVVCAERGSFPREVLKAAKSKNPYAALNRAAFASQNSWSSRVDEIERQIKMAWGPRRTLASRAGLPEPREPKTPVGRAPEPPGQQRVGRRDPALPRHRSRT